MEIDEIRFHLFLFLFEGKFLLCCPFIFDEKKILINNLGWRRLQFVSFLLARMSTVEGPYLVE